MFKFYGLPFVISFFFSIIFCLILIFLFKKKSFNIFSSKNTRTDSRHIHKNKNISRFGGIAIILSFVLTLLLNQGIVFDQKTFVILSGAMIVLFFGLIDDIWELNWKVQLFFQVLIISLIFHFGVQIEFIASPFGGIILFNVFLSFIFTLVWVLVIMNAVNWSDGIDGLMGGIIFLASIVLLFLSLRPDVNQPPLSIISIALAGSVLGFMVFNFPPAKIFAGSGGSFSLGYLIALLAIFAGAKIGATLLVLIVPLTDALFVIWQRWKNKQSFFQADTKHLHHRLIQIGWSHKKVVIFYYSITAIGSIAALFTHSIGKLFTFIIFSLTIFIFCFFMNNLVNNLKAYDKN